MRRQARPPGSGGEIVLFAPNHGPKPRGRGFQVWLEVPEQVAVDLDARKLVDIVRERLAVALRGASTPELRRHWFLEPIAGGATDASAQIVLTSNGGAAYLRRVMDSPKTKAALRAAVAEWLAKACPGKGGVDTPATITTSGGPLP